MRKWIKNNWGKTLALMILGYAAHILIEAFIVTNVLAAFGLKIPVIHAVTLV